MMPYHDTTVPRKKKKKLSRFIRRLLQPSSSHDSNQIKKPWWPLRHHKIEKKSYVDWTTLSPHEPPLPFLIQRPDGPSELAPISKLTSARELYTIVESSETHTNNNSSNSGVASNSHSSKYQTTDDSIEDNLNPYNLVYHHIPIYDWSNQEHSPEPIFNIQLQRNELDCKIIFSQLFLEAYYQQQRKKIQPKEMYILLNDQHNIEGISFILSDGTREDYLEFKGSIQYIAPELFVNPQYHSSQVDIWTLGISLYRMLVGRFPFHEHSDESHLTIIQRMMKLDYDVPKSLSEEARDLIQRLIAPEQTRASFDLVMFHPWIRSYLQKESMPLQPQQSLNKGKEKLNWRKKLVLIIRKILLFIVNGPYPPPTSYRDLAPKEKQD